MVIFAEVTDNECIIEKLLFDYIEWVREFRREFRGLSKSFVFFGANYDT